MLALTIPIIIQDGSVVEIWPTFLSFGSHQGQIIPYVTVNQKPLRVFSFLSPQRNVSISTALNMRTKHHFMNLDSPEDHHLVVEAVQRLGEV